MLSDIDIAQKAKMKPIGEIAAKLGIPASAISPYGHYKAKIGLDYVNSIQGKPDGKLVLVTAISPTPAGPRACDAQRQNPKWSKWRTMRPSRNANRPETRLTTGRPVREKV